MMKLESSHVYDTIANKAHLLLKQDEEVIDIIPLLSICYCIRTG